MVARILLAHFFPGSDSMAQGHCQPSQHFSTFWGTSRSLLQVWPWSVHLWFLLCSKSMLERKPFFQAASYEAFRERGKGHGEGHILRFRPCLLLLPNCHSLSSHCIGWFPASWKPWSHQLHPGPVFLLLWKHFPN